MVKPISDAKQVECNQMSLELGIYDAQTISGNRDHHATLQIRQHAN